MNLKQVKKLFKKYVNDECSSEEILLLETFLDSYQDKNKLWKDLEIEEENVFLEKSWKKIKPHMIETQKKKGLELRYFLRYAAILIGVLLSTTYFFKDEIFNSNKAVETPVIVNTKTIVPGTDKATLTLGDGSLVVLEKGNTFQTQNASSDGEKIVYETSDHKPSEIVYNYLTIPRGGQFFITLSDGTQVWLNSETQLKFPVNFIAGEPRSVELVYGEAYFNVSPSTEHQGAKFKVINNAQEVEVLGTEFNIKAYKDETKVFTTLVEGSVIVDNGMIKNKLVPSEQSTLDITSNSLSVAVVDVKSETSWKDGLFSFRGKPLKEIMKVLSRWYDIDVVFVNKELEGVTFKGVLGKDQKIEEILATIKTLSIMKGYKINGKTVILK